MTIESFMVQFGYPALFVGALLEVESVVVMAGYLAHRGYCSLTIVIVAAFVGAGFGHALDAVFAEAQRYEWIALGTVGAVGVLGWLLHRILERRRNRLVAVGIQGVTMTPESSVLPDDSTPRSGSPGLRVPTAPFTVHRPTGHTRPSPDHEWLLTTGHGGFAMGTASGVNRRKYHGLLIATTRPPVDRLSCLASLDEALIFEDDGGRETGRIHLGGRRYVDGTFDPLGPDYIERFEKEPHVARWIYRVGVVEMIKEVTLGWRRNACAVRYVVRPGGQRLRVLIEPRVTLRDFHSVNTGLDASLYAVAVDGGEMRVTHGGGTLVMRCGEGVASAIPTFTRDVRLEMESERSQEDIEHLFNPGTIEVRPSASGSDGSSSFAVTAALAPDSADFEASDDLRLEHLSLIREGFTGESAGRRVLLPLVDAADDFLVPRVVEGRSLTTILAGYPWFSDWGRDTMISLVGLMLTTRRFEEARGALEVFARFRRDGLIPNVFDDYGGPPQYNTVDASLWFLHACTEYLAASGDRATFDSILLPACIEVIDRYRTGTHFNIRMDPADSLIESGDPTTQLTWMDAKRDGVVFTPRHGKPVEVNALWHHGLLSVAGAIEPVDAVRSAEYRALGRRVAESFRERFWCAGEQRLHDCLQRDSSGVWRAIPQVRPNQIFAVSLGHSPLTRSEQQGVIACVRSRLLTPFGLRTLAPDDPGYQPRFEGDMMRRDRAYHNGTVWPWLIGPYCEAILRANGFSDSARAEACGVLQPLLDSLGEGCLGQIAEVYDGEPPRRPQGCVAQAWSIAEVLRVACMASDGAGRGGDCARLSCR